MAPVVRTRPQAGDGRLSFRATWDDYRNTVCAIGDQHVRVAYDGERVELMSPSQEHEDFAVLIDRIVWALASALGIPCKSLRSSRWERPEAARALEADSCFYLSLDKITVARRRPADPGDWPIPDLAFEIDLSPSKIDRPGIDAALGVPEVWRFDGESLRIDRLGPDGTYSEAAESAWFGVRPEEVVRLLGTYAEDDMAFLDQARAWAVANLVPRRAGQRPDGEG